jgi:formylglycine-generating enzyme
MPALLILVVSVSVILSTVFAQSKQDMQVIGNFSIDRTEVTIGQFQAFANATGFVSASEKAGGGMIFESGWERRKGWSWRSPFGTPGSPSEPAVHLNYDEASNFCQWAGKRLPSDLEWGEAAYIERRENPRDNFVNGKTYRYPVGDQPEGANCLGDCGAVKTVPTAVTSRGRGHALVDTTKQGVNGLFDMGGNVWEWVDSGPGNEKRTRGGSWWYGSSHMLDSHIERKSAAMSAVYIGFRCARSL